MASPRRTALVVSALAGALWAPAIFAAVQHRRLFPTSLMLSVPSMAVDGTGAPHILYPDPHDGLHHAWRDETGKWRDEVVQPRLATAGYHSIAVDAAGRVHAAYAVHTETESTVTHAVRTSAGWTSTGLGPIMMGDPAVAIGPGDRPRVFFRGDNGIFRVASFDGASWSVEDTGIAVEDDWPGAIKGFSVDGADRGHALFRGDGRLVYATDATGGWSTTVVAEGPYVQAALALDAFGHPHVGAGNWSMHPDDHIFHIWYDGTDWRSEEILPSGDTLRSRDMAGIHADGEGRLFVTFTESRYIHHDWVILPRLVHFDGLGWREDYHGGPADGTATSSALAPGGEIHVVLTDWARLRYMRFALPDLEVAWTDVGTTPSEAGFRVEGTVRIRNSGPGGARPTWLRLYLSEDDQFDGGDDPIGSARRIATILPGRERTVRVSARVPGAAAGTRVLAVIDSGERLNDIDRRNNVGPVVVEVPEPGERWMSEGE